MLEQIKISEKIIKKTIQPPSKIAKPNHKGQVTHSHDQLITFVSLRIKNIKNTNKSRLAPLPNDFFMVYPFFKQNYRRDRIRTCVNQLASAPQMQHSVQTELLSVYFFPFTYII